MALDFAVGGFDPVHDGESGIERFAAESAIDGFRVADEVLDRLLVIFRQDAAEVGTTAGEVATGASQAGKGSLAEFQLIRVVSRPESKTGNRQKQQPFHL